jgi:hypothetical protein
MDLLLRESFVRDDILGIPRLERSVNKLIRCYVRKQIDDNLDACIETPIGPDIYARGFTPFYAQGFTPSYAQAHPVGGFLFGTSETPSPAIGRGMLCLFVKV